MFSLKISCPFFICLSILACSSPTSTTKTTTPQSVDSLCNALSSPVPASLALTNEKADFFDAAQKAVEDLTPKPVTAKLDEESYSAGGGGIHVSFNFDINGIPLCQFHGRVHSLSDETIVSGTLPRDLSFISIPTQWTSSGNEVARVMESMQLKGSAKKNKPDKMYRLGRWGLTSSLGSRVQDCEPSLLWSSHERSSLAFRTQIFRCFHRTIPCLSANPTSPSVDRHYHQNPRQHERWPLVMQCPLPHCDPYRRDESDCHQQSILFRSRY